MSLYEILPSHHHTPLLGPADYCMLDLRCFLCLFRYDQGDLIVALLKNGHVTPAVPLCQLDTVRVNAEAQIHMCGRLHCIKLRQAHVYTFHADCYAFSQVSFSPSFGDAIAYDYRPTYDEECVRAKRISDDASAKLAPLISGKLPQPILNIVAEHLVRELGVVHTEKTFSLLKSAKKSTYQLDLRRDIYVGYCKIEGVAYIGWVANECMDGKGLRIYKAAKNKRVKSLWVAIDHFGIRRVYCKKPPVGTSLGAGSMPYWKELQPYDEELGLVCIHDGLKLRDIKHEHRWGPIAWPRLDHEDYEAIHVGTGGALGYHGPLMTLLECHAGQVRGYCAYTSSPYGLVDALMADVYNDLKYSPQVLRTYKTLSYGDWMYMPIDDGEYVEDIWIVDLEYGRSFMFTTNLGRACILGRMGRSTGAPPQFLRIFSRSCGPASRLYIGDINYKTHKGTLETIGRDRNLKQLPYNDVHSFVPTINPEWNPYPPTLTPSTPSWPPFPRLKLFNKAPLEGVSHITCCVHHEVPHRPIVGMMLHYHGGRRACVGLHRHDWVVQPPLVVTAAASTPLVITLYRDCGYDEKSADLVRGIYVMAAAVGETRVQSADVGEVEERYVWKTVTVPWFGWCEWWFTNVERFGSFVHITHVG